MQQTNGVVQTLGIVLVCLGGLGSALGLHLLALVAKRIDEHNEINAKATDLDAESKRANHLEPSYFAAARISYPLLTVRRPLILMSAVPGTRACVRVCVYVSPIGCD